MRKILSIAIVSSCLFGFKIPMYSAYLGKASAEEAKSDMRTIYKTCKYFYIDHGDLPYTIEDMIDSDYLYLYSEGWKFKLEIELGEDDLFEFQGYIEAVSTEEMPDGAGEIILLDVEALEFCGYAQKIDCGREW